MERTPIADLLAAARARLDRVRPEAAREELDGGAILIDIRSDAQRAADGLVPGAIVVPVRDIGLRRATDLDGGFRAWRAAGLPVESAAGH